MMDYDLSIHKKCDLFFEEFKRIAQKKLDTLFPHVSISMSADIEKYMVSIYTTITVAPKDSIVISESQRDAIVLINQIKTINHRINVSMHEVFGYYDTHEFIRHIVINKLMMSICTLDMD